MAAVLATVAAAGLAGPLVPGPAVADIVERGAPSAAPSAISWSPCPADDPIVGGALAGLECGSLDVPLDHSRPSRGTITLALTRAKHTVPQAQYQGIVLLNRGQWPGSFGRDLPTRFANGSVGLPVSVGATYDWIGFDPRGVGASEPSVTCSPDYLSPGSARPDYVPRTVAEEKKWLREARKYADSCGDKYGNTLKYLNTKDTARDMDLIRAALGQKTLNYLGFSYGTYLGEVYASMFPDRVRRMVLDTVAAPDGVGYENMLKQNVAFEKRAGEFFAWIAKYHSVYGLGTTQAAVEKNYHKGLNALAEAPIDGRIGPAEYSDIFLVNAYRTYAWIPHAQVLADWVLRGDPSGLRANYAEQREFPAMNTYAMYTSVQCSDAAWPRDWSRWRTDLQRQQRQGNTFMTWANGWYNAPCAFWPVPAGQPQKVGHSGVNILMLQPENDGAMPVQGALDAHARFPNSRFVLERDGNFHGSSLTGNANACMNAYVSNYLKDGSRPTAKRGADASCAASPAPVPAAG
ncbi:alpha/beta fold hydrolase [Kineosporia babensis]|uniref:Alpha/beta hydrolase n=1 Tax=Kineosporia babensis TaxID=499548 RepID=A0A9X1NIL1_9ACTN|nr:alpha/beta fold hydrolase [Kineosporia babensis]MCD5315707.1 alpha/beta hydrolase [Kineosporia babensis]